MNTKWSHTITILLHLLLLSFTLDIYGERKKAWYLSLPVKVRFGVKLRTAFVYKRNVQFFLIKLRKGTICNVFFNLSVICNKN